MFLRSKWLIAGFLGLLGMLVPFFVFGATIFNDNFQIYNLGDLAGQGDWLKITTQSAQVNTDYAIDGAKSVKGYYNEETKTYRIGTQFDTGQIAVWFFSTRTYVEEHGIQFLIGDQTDITRGCGFKWYEYANGNFSIGGWFPPSVSYTLIRDDLAFDTWHLAIISWDKTNAEGWRCKVEFPNLAPPNSATSTNPTFSGADRVWFWGQDASYQFAKKYLDAISEFGEITPCSFYETWLTCENANCCWYYSTWLQQNFCEECPTGECGEGFWTEACNNCLNQEDCEAVENCYWKENFCKFGTGKCGEGIELQFCENQEDCEEKGGYWYDNYCWLEPKPIFINWNDYYDEYGDYDEPLAWINDLAQSTNKFYESIGGFLTAFKRIFDLKEAHQRGLEFGNSIPVARGYLATLNNFAGGLPFGEFFVFLLAFMIVIGIFRLIRNLIQMIKFW